MNKEEKELKRFELIKAVSNNENINIEDNILEELIFEGKRIVLPNRVLRKLDLSRINFNNKDLSNTNLSNTNCNINPTKVYCKDLSSTSLENVNM